MFRKCILTFAAAATLGAAALASTPASAHWGGHHMGHMGVHMVAFHQMRAFPRVAYRQHFVVRHRLAFRHPFFFRHRFAVVRAPILIDDGCWRVHHIWTDWGWRWRRIWVCG
jgi:hypothetical protein